MPVGTADSFPSCGEPAVTSSTSAVPRWASDPRWRRGWPRPISLADRLTDDAAHWLPRPRHTHIRKVALPNCPTEGVRAEHSGTARAILYLHGGAFLTCGLNTHRALVSCLSRSADAPVLYVGYRLQPRYPIGSAVADALDDYRWLPETGYGDGDIVVAGDSAAATLLS